MFKNNKNNTAKVVDKKTLEKYEMKENFMEIYCHNFYRFFGRRLFFNKKFKNFFYTSIYNNKYEGILKQANLKLMPEEYFLTIFLNLIIYLFLIVMFSTVFFFINSVYSALIFFGGIFSIAILGIFLYNYPIVIAKNRGTEIDASIPYLLPYLKILSKELSLAKIVEIIGDFLIYKEIRIEFKKIEYYSNVLGYDIQSSIREAMISCPSRQLADMMNDLVTISNSGGNIYNYLERKLENLNTEIDAIEKKNIETLLIYSQIYVVILLIAPLFYTIMSTILSLIDFSSTTGAASGGSNTVASIFAMLVFLPIVYIGFMMLVFYSKPLYSRLKPIKNDKNEL